MNALPFELYSLHVPVIRWKIQRITVILRSVVSVQHRLGTDGRTDTRRQLIPALA